MMQQMSLSDVGMDDSLWRRYRVDNPYIHEGNHEIPYMSRVCYEIDFEGRMATLGVYVLKGEEIFKAWGYKSEEHCSYHAIKTNGVWSQALVGCPDFKLLFNNTTVTGFSLGDTTIHVTNDRASSVEREQKCCTVMVKERTFFETLTLFKPLILTALLSLLFGFVITFFETFTVEGLVMNSMGAFITLLGLLKIRDVNTFVHMFRRYDPLAQKSIHYARAYPYLETTLGVLILSGVLVVPAQLAVIGIYTITSIGIIRSLKAKENLTCACLGGGVTLPLSRVTIFENSVMIIMACSTLMSYFS